MRADLKEKESKITAMAKAKAAAEKAAKAAESAGASQAAGAAKESQARSEKELAECRADLARAESRARRLGAEQVPAFRYKLLITGNRLTGTQA
jgi:hypothetical protein